MSDNKDMDDYSFSKRQLAELEQTHRTLRDKRQADRVKAVIALSKGWSAATISEILLLDEKTSRNYFNRYQHGGLAALLKDDYAGAEPKLTEQQMQALETYLDEHVLPDAKTVIAYIKQQYGVCYSLSGMTDLLHRMGFSYKKPPHVPGKQNPAQQHGEIKGSDAFLISLPVAILQFLHWFSFFLFVSILKSVWPLKFFCSFLRSQEIGVRRSNFTYSYHRGH